MIYASEVSEDEQVWPMVGFGTVTHNQLVHSVRVGALESGGWEGEDGEL